MVMVGMWSGGVVGMGREGMGSMIKKWIRHMDTSPSHAHGKETTPRTDRKKKKTAFHVCMKAKPKIKGADSILHPSRHLLGRGLILYFFFSCRVR